MKIRFFGDSWYWTWFDDEHTVKSTTLKNKLCRFGFPVYEFYFKGLGIDVVSYNSPGKDFYQIVDSIITTDTHDDIKYNVVFFSSLVRHVQIAERAGYDVRNLQNFMNKFNEDTIKGLSNIQDWAEKNNQQVLLMGGQSTLYQSIFDKVKKKDNLHLMCECVLSHIIGLQKPYGIFKLSTDFNPNIPDYWDKDLVINIFDERKRVENEHDHWIKYTFPDSAHPNTTTALVITDMILHKIEQLEK